MLLSFYILFAQVCLTILCTTQIEAESDELRMIIEESKNRVAHWQKEIPRLQNAARRERDRMAQESSSEWFIFFASYAYS